MPAFKSIKESRRERRRVNWIEHLIQDFRYGLRMLFKNPGFTAVAALTLALGIGATTAIVSVVKTAVFDPLPAEHPARLVQLGVVRKEQDWHPGINPPALRDVRQQTNLFARVIVYYPFDLLTLRGEEFPQPAPGVRVTPEFFGLWNLRPCLGRTFASDEGQPGRDDVLVISYQFWQRQFGGDHAIIGRTVPFRERPMTVVGVMPPHFAFLTARDEYPGGPAASQTHPPERGRLGHSIGRDTRDRTALRSRARVAGKAVQPERSAEAGSGHQHAGPAPRIVQPDTDCEPSLS